LIAVSFHYLKCIQKCIVYRGSSQCQLLSTGALLNLGALQTLLQVVRVMVLILSSCLQGLKTIIILLLMARLWKRSHTMVFLHMDVKHHQVVSLLQGINLHHIWVLR
jgi:hypothetical protein